MTEVPDYVPPGGAPTQAVHNAPAPSAQWQGLSQDQLSSLRSRLVTSIIQVVVQAVTGIFVPGGGSAGALGQLTDWANGLPGIGPIVQAITGVFGNVTDLANFFNPTSGTNFLSGLINGVVGGSGNPLSSLITSLLGTQSTASTAGTNATTALGNWTSLLSGIPGISTIAGFLGFLQPTTGTSGIFAPLINGVVGGTTNPLSSLLSSLLGTASTASTANTNASTALGNWTSVLAGLPGVSTISSFLSFLNPGTGANGIFAPLINGVAGGTTNPLSSLISSLTGTASTASTASSNATTALGNWTSLLAGIPGVSTVAGFLGFLQPTGSDRGIFGTLINGVVGGTTNPLSSLISSFTGTASTASTAGTNASTALSTTGSMIDDLFNGISNLLGSGRTQAEMADAVAAQSNTVVGTSATTAQILAALGSGAPDADDFERTSSSNLGANWTIYQTGTGTLATPNGHDAAITGSADAVFVARKENKDAAGDNQIVSVVLSTAAEAAGDTILIPTEYGQNDLWCRMTTFASYATRTGVRLRFGADKSVKLSWFNSGTETVLATTTIANKPAAGATLELQAGVGLTQRHFIGKLNGTPVIDFTEAGTTSQFGATYRRRGFGGETQHAIIVTAHPGGVKQWTTQG